jgi:2-iminoacetate synthase ThiH
MTLLEDSLRKSNLWSVRALRRRGDLEAVRARMPALLDADLLALGALADEVRKVDVGDEVRFSVQATEATRRAFRGVQIPRAGRTGFAFLREVAIARICAEPGACVRVDWDDAGFELSQVALGFGANEIWGALANKRGLPILDEEMKKVKGEGMVSLQALKRRELEKLLSYVGRKVVFIDAPMDADSEETAHAP